MRAGSRGCGTHGSIWRGFRRGFFLSYPRRVGTRVFGPLCVLFPGRLPRARPIQPLRGCGAGASRLFRCHGTEGLRPDVPHDAGAERAVGRIVLMHRSVVLQAIPHRPGIEQSVVGTIGYRNPCVSHLLPYFVEQGPFKDAIARMPTERPVPLDAVSLLHPSPRKSVVSSHFFAVNT